MTSRRQFGLILVSVVVLAALMSHATVKWLGLQSRIGDAGEAGRQFHSTPALIAGSSMIGFALDWELLAADLSRPIEGVAAPSASPCELEILTRSMPNTDLTIVGVSIYELDEQFMSDFRADCVPISQTARDLLDSHSDWPFFKRTMSRYPLYYLRWLFPTAGRSVGVMVGVRSKLRKVGRLAGKEGEEPLPTVNAMVWPTNRVADWPEGRVLRNLSERRSECRELHGFDGPKHLAFGRMLRRLATQGKVVVVVLPVSPPYENELIKLPDKQAFEKSLGEIAKNAPSVKWIRLDQIPELHSSDFYWDLIHLNVYGRKIATDAFRTQFKSMMRSP